MERIGPYRVIRKLGEGGMGAVYLAHDDRLDRRVALKVIGTLHSDNAVMRARLQREARAAAQLNHPNICAVYDVGETSDGDPFIAMELIEGMSLRARLEQVARPLDTREAIEIAEQVADALAEAHKRGVVHRDIKPDNIMLTAGGRVKVVDFGLARIAENTTDDEHPTAVQLTREGTVMGTTHYMSPEQSSGVADLDGRSDIFSLGVVLYRMLTGVVPFTGRNAAEVQHNLSVSEPRPITSVNSSVPAELERITSKCLAKQRERRYQSAADLSVDLRALREPSRNSQPTPAATHQRRPVLIIAAMLTLVVAAYFIWARRPKSAEGVATPAASTEIRSIAVLPLLNTSGDTSRDYFAAAMTDELTSRLASIPSLRVASRSSASRFQNAKLPMQEIARQLGVDAVLEGSAAQSAQNVRLNVRLIDGRADRLIWSHTYAREASDALTLQNELAGDVAEQIRSALSPTEEARVKRQSTRNPAAYDAYLRSIYKLAPPVNGGMPESSIDESMRLAQEAITIDPQFADAYVALARGCIEKMFSFNRGREFDECAYVAIEKALTLDPALPSAYTARGMVRYTHVHQFDIAGAITDYRKAIALNPNFVQAHHNLGTDLVHAGFHDMAVKEFETALRLDPDNFGAKYRLARALWQSNRFEESLQTYRRYDIKRFELAVVLAYLGRKAEAWEVAQQEPVGPEYLGAQSDLAASRAFLHALEGNRAAADKEAARSFSLGSKLAHYHHAAVIIAAGYAELGAHAEAVRFLRLAADNGMPNYPMFRDNPSLRKLHGNAQYEQFMSELKPRWDRVAEVVNSKQ